VHMLAVTPRGRAYTYAEVAQWLEAAGLGTPKQVQYGGGDASILVAPKK